MEIFVILLIFVDDEDAHFIIEQRTCVYFSPAGSCIDCVKMRSTEKQLFLVKKKYIVFTSSSFHVYL